MLLTMLEVRSTPVALSLTDVVRGPQLLQPASQLSRDGSRLLRTTEDGQSF